MIQNDVLRRLRYILNYDDFRMMDIFAKGGFQTTREYVCDVLRSDTEPAYRRLLDRELSAFLNGLIIEMRGEREGPKPQPETFLNNNMILQKLKIAYNLKADDVLAILASCDITLSSHELSSFFRKPGHKHFRECKDQIMRNFLMGLQLKHRPKES